MIPVRQVSCSGVTIVKLELLDDSVKVSVPVPVLIMVRGRVAVDPRSTVPNFNGGDCDAVLPPHCPYRSDRL